MIAKEGEIKMNQTENEWVVGNPCPECGYEVRETPLTFLCPKCGWSIYKVTIQDRWMKKYRT